VASAAVSDYDEQKKSEAAVKKKVPWRNSLIVYKNQFSAISLDKSAEPQYNPYYINSFSFLPRYYIKDDLSLRLRLDLEIELTTADDTDYAHEWVVSDLSLEFNYAPSVLKIPLLDVAVNPSLRLYFPTSKASQARSMIMALGPGLAFRRQFALLKGNWLSSIGLSYSFRAVKYFNEYTTRVLSDPDAISMGHANPSRSDFYSDPRRNTDWRFYNGFNLLLQVHEKVSFSASLFLINDLLYGLSELDMEDYVNVVGLDKTIPASDVNSKMALWSVFDISYDALDWLWLSIGVSTFHPQQAPDSTNYDPFFNRFTQVYFDITLPVDRVISKVQDWTGWGKGGEDS